MMNQAQIDIPAKKRQAKKLYTSTMLTAKQIGLQIGISEKTMSKWVKMYGWKSLRQMKIAKDLGTGKADDIAALKIHLNRLNPQLFTQIEPLIDNYLQLKK